MEDIERINNFLKQCDSDIVDVKYLLNKNNDIRFEIKFHWNEDYGCFSKELESILTVICNKEDLHILQKNLEDKDFIYNDIKNHKYYVGKLDKI